MSWTKRQLVEAAFEEAGMAAFAFDLTAQQMQSAITRLDSMMAAWDATDGIRIGYNVSATPDPDDLSGIPDTANEAVFTGLAIRLAPSYGKQISMDTRNVFRQGFEQLKIASAMPEPMQIPAGYPIGAGHRYLEQPFKLPEEPSLSAGGDPLEFTE